MRILIIGGTGLISTWITKQLLDRGDHDLTLYNRGQTESRVAAAVTTLQGDRTDFKRFEAQMEEAGPFDCVIDMVCYDPAEAQSIVRAFKGKVGHYIFCSTVDVYSKPPHRLPYVEDEPYGGLNTYARNKVAIEKILTAAHDAQGFPVTIIRPAYTYGETRGPIHSLGGSLTYLDRIRRGKPIVVHGDGSSLWAACHGDDVARAFVNAIGQPTAFGKAYHTPGEEWLSWNIYHQQVAEALNAPAPTLVHIPTDLLAQAAPTRAGWCADNAQFSNIFDTTAAHRDLGFVYTISWKQGVRRIVDWLDARKLIPNSDTDPLDDQLIETWQQLAGGMLQAFQSNKTS